MRGKPGSVNDGNLPARARRGEHHLGALHCLLSRADELGLHSEVALQGVRECGAMSGCGTENTNVANGANRGDCADVHRCLEPASQHGEPCGSGGRESIQRGRRGRSGAECRDEMTIYESSDAARPSIEEDNYVLHARGCRAEVHPQTAELSALLERFVARRYPRAGLIVNNSVQLAEWEVNHAVGPGEITRLMLETPSTLQSLLRAGCRVHCALASILHFSR